MFDLWAFFLAGCVTGLVEAIGLLYQARTVDFALATLLFHILLLMSLLGVFLGGLLAGTRRVVSRVTSDGALAPYVLAGMVFLGLFVPLTHRIVQKDFQNPVLLSTLLGVLALVCAVVAGGTLLGIFRLRKWFPRGEPVWGLVAMAAVAVGYWLLRGEIAKLDFPFLGSFNALIAMGVVYSYALQLPLLGPVAAVLRRKRFLWLFAVIAVVNGVLIFIPHVTPTHARALDRGAPLTGALFSEFGDLTDWDGDGFSNILGGGDCQAFDASVHPGALDYPDNGIDENCDGRDSTPEDLISLDPPQYFEAPLPEPMNVILISVDALRRDHMGVYGYHRNTTPNIDRISEQSTRFKNSFSHSSRTLYSLAGFLYGVPISLIQWEPRPKKQIALPENQVGVPTLLRSYGVHTVALLDCFRIFKLKFGLDKDFDDYDTQSVCVSTYQPKVKKAAERTRAAIRKLKKITQKRNHDPFFLWIHYLEPHAPYRSMPGSPNYGKEAMDRYDSTVHYTDRAIGDLWDYLVDSGLSRNTAVIITGDHGDEFKEHGRRYHGKTLYNETIGVPLIVYMPGVAPQVSEMPVSHLDIPPTILNMFGVPQEEWPRLYGRNLLPTIFGLPPRGDEFTFSIHAEKRKFNTVDLALIQPPWVMISKPRKRSYELYRIDEDYLQSNDLYEPGTEKSDEFKLKIDRLMQFLELEKAEAKANR